MAMKRKMPAGIVETGLKPATRKRLKPAKAKAVTREKITPGKEANLFKERDLRLTQIPSKFPMQIKQEIKKKD